MEATSKVCHQCGEEIKKIAKKCPFCQSWQKGANSFLANQPATISLLALIPMVIFIAWMTFFSNGIFNREKADFGQYQNLILVRASQINYSKDGDTAYISTIGTIKNDSDKKWRRIVIEVQYFNEASNLVDAHSSSDWDFVLPIKTETTFRVRQAADKPAGEYKTHKVIVKDA